MWTETISMGSRPLMRCINVNDDVGFEKGSLEKIPTPFKGSVYSVSPL